MKLITFESGAGPSVGAVKGDGVIELSSRLEVSGVRDLLARGLLATARKIWEAEAAEIPLDAVTLGLPVRDPEMILCVGVNYMNRNAEYKDGSDAPPYPSLFVRGADSFAPHGAEVLIPPESEQLDYEGEIVLVIGKAGRRIAQADAMDHVAGLTVMNEGTIRDWVRHGKFNVTPGKNWHRSGGLGPWVQTDLSGIEPTDMWVETRVNGEVRQRDTTANMTFPFARIIEYVSTFRTLAPGDMIATGTPIGAGARFDPPVWLREGDVIEVEVEGVGTLSNTVAKEVI
jgi:2-keto-4-pentenoate hydratase/2-oxohepta-3-ene-1,7-dioic acid hydratase in catechol pathway